MTPLTAVESCLSFLVARRVEQDFLEYPVGHPDRRTRPVFVQEWEAKHGPAPASARAFINAFAERQEARRPGPR
jgi:uncharacterized protein (DUF2336 family)